MKRAVIGGASSLTAILRGACQRPSHEGCRWSLRSTLTDSLPIVDFTNAHSPGSFRRVSNRSWSWPRACRRLVCDRRRGLVRPWVGGHLRSVPDVKEAPGAVDVRGAHHERCTCLPTTTRCAWCPPFRSMGPIGVHGPRVRSHRSLGSEASWPACVSGTADLGSGSPRGPPQYTPTRTLGRVGPR